MGKHLTLPENKSLCMLSTSSPHENKAESSWSWQHSPEWITPALVCSWNVNWNSHENCNKNAPWVPWQSCIPHHCANMPQHMTCWYKQLLPQNTKWRRGVQDNKNQVTIYPEMRHVLLSDNEKLVMFWVSFLFQPPESSDLIPNFPLGIDALFQLIF